MCINSSVTRSHHQANNDSTATPEEEEEERRRAEDLEVSNCYKKALKRNITRTSSSSLSSTSQSSTTHSLMLKEFWPNTNKMADFTLHKQHYSLNTISFLLIGLIGLTFSSSKNFLVNANVRNPAIIVPLQSAHHASSSSHLTTGISSLEDDNYNNNSPNQQRALNYLLFSSSNNKHLDAKLNDLLKDSNHSHVSDTINLQLANSVWTKMRQNALEFAQQRAKEVKPTIDRLLNEANISSHCRESLNSVLDRLSKLDAWAVQMYNSFGDFPAAGFFEGSLTSMGSYHQCVDLEPNQWIGKPQYCTFKFQPIVPKRPKYHNILAPIENLANFTSKDDVSVVTTDC